MLKNHCQIEKIELIIEAGGSKESTGRATYKGNLIVYNGETVDQLEEQVKSVLQGFEGIDPSSCSNFQNQ